MENKLSVVITGGLGFIGRNVAQQFKENGYFVIGIGHGKATVNELQEIGFDEWHEADLSLKSLEKYISPPNLIIHCAGGSTVGISLENPYLDFHKTVNSTLELLEYIRVCSPQTSLIYLSSAAIYGSKEDKLIDVNEYSNPVSPYGFHKLASENLCKSYNYNFNIKVAIVRLFSIYGEGLQKQLLWEASRKIVSAKNDLVFFGTGDETRDWLHVKDVAKLVMCLASQSFHFLILNGGFGERITVKEILNRLLNEFGRTDIKIGFNDQTKIGDPKYYHADISDTNKLGWIPSIDLSEGLKNYVEWFKSIEE